MKEFLKIIINFIEKNDIEILGTAILILIIRFNALQYKVNKLIFEINENFKVYNQNVVKEEIIFKVISKKLGGKKWNILEVLTN